MEVNTESVARIMQTPVSLMYLNVTFIDGYQNLAILLLLYFQCLGLGIVLEVVTSVFML